MVEKECCKGSRNMTREQKTILYWSTVREIFQTMAEITRHYLNSIFIFAIEHQKKNCEHINNNGLRFFRLKSDKIRYISRNSVRIIRDI